MSVLETIKDSIISGMGVFGYPLKIADYAFGAMSYVQRNLEQFESLPEAITTAGSQFSESIGSGVQRSTTGFIMMFALAYLLLRGRK